MFRFFVFALVFSVGCAPEAFAPPEPPEDMAIYLLAGQSNMSGRAPVEAIDLEVHPRVWVLRGDGRWWPAVEPLHEDSPSAGVGPGLAFGKAMAEARPGRHIGLIPAAVGGATAARWGPGAGLSEAALERARLAQGRGALAGIIWHQGEADARLPEGLERYPAALEAVFAGLRAGLGRPALPVVVAPLGPWRQDQESLWVNEAIAELPARLDRCAVAPVDGLESLDGVHFDAASARALGARYAEAMRGLRGPWWLD